MSDEKRKTEYVRTAINEQLTSAGEQILCVLEKQCGVDVCSVRPFVLERHSVAAKRIYKLFQREMETLETLLERRNKLLLDAILQPRVTLNRTGWKWMFVFVIISMFLFFIA